MSKVIGQRQRPDQDPDQRTRRRRKEARCRSTSTGTQQHAGVRHLAATDDELHSIAELRRRGVDSDVPDTYYRRVRDRVDGMLRQHGHKPVRGPRGREETRHPGRRRRLRLSPPASRKPLQDRPTLFFGDHLPARRPELRQRAASGILGPSKIEQANATTCKPGIAVTPIAKAAVLRTRYVSSPHDAVVAPLLAWRGTQHRIGGGDQLLRRAAAVTAPRPAAGDPGSVRWWVQPLDRSDRSAAST